MAGRNLGNSPSVMGKTLHSGRDAIADEYQMTPGLDSVLTPVASNTAQ
jgi:hypothetical protein